MSANKRKRIRRLRKELMSSETPSPEEVAALLNGLQQDSRQPEQREPSALEIACGGRLLLVQTPANITLKDENGGPGEVFYVTDLQAWGYTPFGILAVGSYTKDAGEDDWESNLYPPDVIHHIQFNKARYEEIIEEIKAENAEPADEGDTSGDSAEAVAVAEAS